MRACPVLSHSQSREHRPGIVKPIQSQNSCPSKVCTGSGNEVVVRYIHVFRAEEVWEFFAIGWPF